MAEALQWKRFRFVPLAELPDGALSPLNLTSDGRLEINPPHGESKENPTYVVQTDLPLDDEVNSYVGPLAGDETRTGGFTSTIGYAETRLTCRTNGADIIVYFDFATQADPDFIVRTAPSFFPAGTGSAVVFPAIADFYRVRIENQESVSTDVKVNVYQSKRTIGSFVNSIESPVQGGDPAALSKSVITGRTPGGGYQNVMVNPQGRLLSEVEGAVRGEPIPGFAFLQGYEDPNGDLANAKVTADNRILMEEASTGTNGAVIPSKSTLISGENAAGNLQPLKINTNGDLEVETGLQQPLTDAQLRASEVDVRLFANQAGAPQALQARSLNDILNATDRGLVTASKIYGQTSQGATKAIRTNSDGRLFATLDSVDVTGNPIPPESNLVGAEDPAGNLQALKTNANGSLTTSDDNLTGANSLGFVSSTGVLRAIMQQGFLTGSPAQSTTQTVRGLLRNPAASGKVLVLTAVIASHDEGSAIVDLEIVRNPDTNLPTTVMEIMNMTLEDGNEIPTVAEFLADTGASMSGATGDVFLPTQGNGVNLFTPEVPLLVFPGNSIGVNLQVGDTLAAADASVAAQWAEPTIEEILAIRNANS